MEFVIDIPDSKSSEDFMRTWKEGSELSVDMNYDDFEITGNRNGLISLAAFFMGLAQEGVPDGTSILLTDKNGLSKGSLDLMIIKKE